MKGHRIFLLLSLLLVEPTICKGESLNDKAWSKVWNAFEKRLPHSSGKDTIHLLNIRIPATWGKDDEDTNTQLVEIASAIPNNDFILNPSVFSRKLHNIYTDLTIGIKGKSMSDKQSKKYNEALDQYGTDLDKLINYKEKVNNKWRVEREFLIKHNKPYGMRAEKKYKFGFRREAILSNKASNSFSKVHELMPNDPFLQKLLSDIDHHRRIDYFPYNGGKAVLRAINEPCKDDKGWDSIKFSQRIKEETTNTKKWNAKGSWGEGFLNINAGGKGSKLETIITSDKESLELSFCNLTFISIRPGNWWDPRYLKGIDDGTLKLRKDNKYYGADIFGKDGLIPRVIKGAIVARDIRFSATISKENRHEINKSLSSKAGFRIGPFKVNGGSQKKTKSYKKEERKDGSYHISTNYKTPVILAIITESTALTEPTD